MPAAVRLEVEQKLSSGAIFEFIGVEFNIDCIQKRNICRRKEKRWKKGEKMDKSFVNENSKHLKKRKK